MKPRCPKCGCNIVRAQSLVRVTRTVTNINPDVLYAPTLDPDMYLGGHVDWDSEEAMIPQYMCGICGHESDDIEDFMEGG